MKNIRYVLTLALIVLFALPANSQNNPNPHKLLDALGRNANTFFLLANRPSFGMSSYLTDKGYWEISIDPTLNKDASEVPFMVSYGLSRKVELSAGMDLFKQSYRFDGKKISGVGDANIGVKFKIQESKSFTHAVQMIVKIPTASTKDQLGTGHPDYHFGIMQGYSNKNFGYDFALQIGLLQRRDIPVLNSAPVYTQALLDSMRVYYDYKFEPEISVSMSPSVSLSDKFQFYFGAAFSRNTKLDYNSTAGYAGFSYSPTDVFGLSAGISNSFQEGGAMDLNLGFAFTFR
jgi:hypothetical protein